MSSIFYLGVDGGGTSTTAAVADASGKIVGIGKAGPSLYKVVGLAQAIRTMRDAVIAAEHRARVKRRPYSHAVFGLSGVDSMKDWRILSRAVFKGLRPITGERFRIVNDVVIALAAGTTARYGASVIAGTGSNAYAVGPKGETYAGGLGMLMSDEGSGYWVGCEMLRAAVKSFDGRGPKTALEGKACRALRVAHMRDAGDALLDVAASKTRIAALAPFCFEAAREGDRIARSIVVHASSELALMAIAVIKKSGLRERSFDLALAGSLFKAGDMLLRPFRASVTSVAPKARIQPLSNLPVVGAVRLAREAGVR